MMSACSAPAASGPASSAIAEIPSVPVVSPSPDEHESSTPPSSDAPEATSSDADSFWIEAVGTGPEFITFPSLKAAVQGSDAVVVGTISSIKNGPEHRDDYGNVGHFATVDVVIDEAIRGVVATRNPGHVEMRIVLGVSRAVDDVTFEEQFRSLEASLPKEQALLMLFNTADYAKRIGAPPNSGEDAFAYELFGGQSVIRNASGSAKPFPMEGWTEELSGRTFESVVEEARRAGS